ncbi:MAG: NAD-dependent deacylase [Anaerolineales bacterium]|nr:NAD-dependent deacylase [Anaerolineales bacterium]
MGTIPSHLVQRIQQAADILGNCKRVTILTGAGISTSSGIPDFRSPESGLWEKYSPLEVASLATFRYTPDIFFHWLHPLAQIIIDAHPNPAHIALADLEKSRRDITIITQNIDGLHQKAGSTHVLEVHGNLRTLTCVSCFTQQLAEAYLDDYIKNRTIPKCPLCDHILKPDVVLMGEQLPARTWLKAQETSKHCELMIVAGSSLEVLPVAGLPMRAIENGAHLIVVNKSRTYIDVRADIVFHENVAEILPMIVQEVSCENH